MRWLDNQFGRHYHQLSNARGKCLHSHLLRFRRTSAREERFQQKAICSSFPRRSTSTKNPNRLMLRGSHYSGRLQLLSRFSTSSRHSLTVLNFRKLRLVDWRKFRPECCIISLIYINRLIAFTEIPLQPTNWRPLTLCSLLVAQKVWDDRYLSNADFAFIYPFFVTSEINKLEKKFLELIQYNVTVRSNLYAKYYFELSALQKDDLNEIPMMPLDKRQCE